MDFDQAIERLTRSLQRWKPCRFNRHWVDLHEPKVYKFINKNIRMERGITDWERVIRKLDRSLQALWLDEPVASLLPYSDPSEVEIALKKYKKYWKKRSALFTSERRENDTVRNLICVTLVRLAQRGNVAAEEELIDLLIPLLRDWMNRYPCLWWWQWYPEQLRETCQYCIYRYRYTGMFLGYLHNKLQFSARDLPKLQFLEELHARWMAEQKLRMSRKTRRWVKA